MSVIKKIRDIIKGWYYQIFKNNRIEKMAAERMQICKNCSLYDLSGKKCAVPGTGPCCGDCGCALSAATRSPEYSCPQNKW